MKLKSILAIALCAVGLSAFAKEPDAVQLWEGGPYFATCNIGAEKPEDYGILTNFNDAAQAVTGALGEGWRVPSKEEFDKLVDDSYCTSQWDSTKKGYTFTGKGDYSTNSIFFPAAGYDYGQGCKYAGSKGYYWSSTEVVGASQAWYLYFYQGGENVESKISRSYLASVRAVRDTPPPPPALAVANVKTATHWPWDGKIDVTCDLTGSGKVQLSAALTTNGVTVCTATAANVTGATEIDLDQVGGVTNGVKFVWNAKADCPAGFNSKDTKVKVTAKKFTPPPAGQLWEKGPIWAECNVGDGATVPGDYGALYTFDDNEAADAAKSLGADWRLPTAEEFTNLLNNCEKTGRPARTARALIERDTASRERVTIHRTASSCPPPASPPAENACSPRATATTGLLRRKIPTMRGHSTSARTMPAWSADPVYASCPFAPCGTRSKLIDEPLTI